jgi:hypothetical protein
MARMRGALLAVEISLKTIGEGTQKVADQLAEKIREFRDGHDDQGEGDGYAGKH